MPVSRDGNAISTHSNHERAVRVPSETERGKVAANAGRGDALASASMRARVSQRLFGGDTDDAPYPSLGRFVVTGVLGSGGTGIVYAGFDPQLDRRVALKVLDPERVAGAPERARLTDEARALARLAHPNVVTIYEVGESRGAVFLVMEHVEGGPLDKWAARRCPTIDELLEIYQQAGQGLAAAHAAGLVHRDFKPANVLVGQDGRVRVLDFGLARPPEIGREASSASGGSPEGGSRSTLAGTPAYMAPEQAAMRTADTASDQFSFCVALWEAVEGERPWKSSELAALARASDRPLLPRATKAPKWLAGCLARGLSLHPRDRYPSLDELLADLRRQALAGPRRRLAIYGAVIVVVVVGTFAAVVLGSTSSTGCPPADAELAGVWDTAAQARLAAISELPGFGVPAQQGIHGRMEGYASRWRATLNEICEARFERRTWSDAQLEHGLACLRRRRASLGSLLGLLDTADAEVVAHADAMIDALPDPDRCGELGAAENSATDDGVAEVLTHADDARLFAAAGRLEDARSAAERAIELAGDVEATPLGQAEALIARGIVRATSGESAAAAADFAGAAASAQRAGSNDASGRAWLGLAAASVRGLQDRQRGELALAMASASLDRIDAPARLHADRLDIEASLAGLRDDRDAAPELRYQALRLLSTSVGPDDPFTLTVQRRLANDLASLARYDEAAGVYAEVRERVVGRLGELHPDVGSIELDLGLLERDRGRLDAAARHFDRALEVTLAAFGADSPRLARIFTALALNDFELGELDRAERRAEQAWALQRVHLPVGHSERAGGLSLLAAIHVQNKELERALAEHLTLLEELDPSKDASRVVVANNTAGWLLCQLDRCSEAEAHYREVLRGEDPWPLYAEGGLARIELVRGQVAAARERVERALAAALVLPGDEHAELIAEMRWTLAEALADLGERDSGRRIAKQALADFVAIGVRPETVVKVEQLIARLR